MSTALLSAVLLLGCDVVGPPGSMSLLENEAGEPTSLIASAALARGQIIVLGPDGYCIDPASLRTSGTNGFAAIASCNILSDGTIGPIVEPVLVTVTVNAYEDAAPGPDDLSIALGTKLLQSRKLGAVELGQLATGGESAFAGSDPRHWRGAFLIGGHLVGVTLYAPQGSPLVGVQGASFLNEVSSRIQTNSRAVLPNSAEQSQSSVDPVEQRLGRLFEGDDLQ